MRSITFEDISLATGLTEAWLQLHADTDPFGFWVEAERLIDTGNKKILREAVNFLSAMGYSALDIEAMEDDLMCLAQKSPVTGATLMALPLVLIGDACADLDALVETLGVAYRIAGAGDMYADNRQLLSGTDELDAVQVRCTLQKLSSGMDCGLSAYKPFDGAVNIAVMPFLLHRSKTCPPSREEMSTRTWRSMMGTAHGCIPGLPVPFSDMKTGLAQIRLLLDSALGSMPSPERVAQSGRYWITSHLSEHGH